MLATKRLGQESAELPAVSQTNAVSVSEEKARTIGTLLHVEVLIEGLPVKAMIDTGAQSTIISRATLHDVYRHLKSKQQELPPLEIPTVHLYGKGGADGRRELVITAQVPLQFTLGDRSVSVPVLCSQIDSEQTCLLGINAIPALGIDVTWNKGNPCDPSSSDAQRMANVSLVKSVTVPCNKGKVTLAKLSCMNLGGNLLFPPNHESLESCEVTIQESVLTANEQGEVLLAIENNQGIAAHSEMSRHLGTVKTIKVIEMNSDSYLLDVDRSLSATVSAVENSTSRTEQLFAQLNLPVNSLKQEEVEKLRTLLVDFSDVFAFSDAELGCTDVLQHPIDTGEHAAFKQQPY